MSTIALLKHHYTTLIHSGALSLYYQLSATHTDTLTHTHPLLRCTVLYMEAIKHLSRGPPLSSQHATGAELDQNARARDNGLAVT